MKTRFFSLSISILFCCYAGFCSEISDDQKGSQSASGELQSLQIVCSPELNDLATTWITGFGNLYPEQKSMLSCQSETNSFKKGNLYLISKESSTLVNDKSVWKMVIGHEPIVAIINSDNPFLKEINSQGFTAENFAKVITENSNWSELINGATKTAIKCFISDDEQVISKITGFTKTTKEQISSTKITDVNGLVSLVQQDKNAIGFCKLASVLNAGRNGFAEKISIVPIDKNRNGRIDNFENIYSSPEILTRGAWIGKYPRELSGEIYALSTEKPTNQAAIDFLTFISGVGQDNIKKSGYSILSSSEKTANMLLLSNTTLKSDIVKKSSNTTLGWILIISFVVVFLLLFSLFRFDFNKQKFLYSDDIEITPALNENSILAPKGLLYDKTHTWAFMEQDGLVKIGVDDFLKHVTGSISQLKMKEPGEKVRKGEKILTLIHNGKQLNLYSPVSGFIRKLNTFLIDTPSKINILPYTNAWVYQIEPLNWKREAGFMFMFDKYRDWLEDEFIRLKDFLAMSANENTTVYEHIVLQDGGELKDNVLADLEPEIWEDFQTKFIDTSK